MIGNKVTIDNWDAVVAYERNTLWKKEVMKEESYERSGSIYWEKENHKHKNSK